MKKKTILFLYYGECYALPPFLAILDCLKKAYNLVVICNDTASNQERLREQYPSIDFYKTTPLCEKEAFANKVIRHIYHPVPFYFEAKRALNSISYDLLWVIHERTLVAFKDVLKDKKYIASIYELNDHNMKFAKKMEPGVANAEAIITCEYNRSCIMRVWYKLNYTPMYVPNKPFNHPRQKCMPCNYSKEFAGKKIIMYQGGITKVRNIDALCQAVEELDDYTLVLMGGGEHDYINHLRQTYKKIILTGFINPPEHLYITSHARIGVIKYDYVFLDHAYCAPNRIWEFTGFGIPILGNDLPGLEYTIGNAGAGICVDMETPENISRAIREIDKSYDTFSKNAYSFYDSFDLSYALNKIVKTYID